MPDFLTNLSQRVLGTAPLVRPSFPSIFAPQSRGSEAFTGSGPGVGASSYGGYSGTDSGMGMNDAAIGSAGEDPGGDRDDLHPFSPADRIHGIDRPAEQDGPQPTRRRTPQANSGRSLLPPVPDSGNETFPNDRDRRKDESGISPGAPLLAPGYESSKESRDDGDRIAGGFSSLDSDSVQRGGEDNRSAGSEGNDYGRMEGRRSERRIGSNREGREQGIERTIRKDGPPRLVPPVPEEGPQPENRRSWTEEGTSDRRRGEAFAQRLRSSSDDNALVPGRPFATSPDSMTEAAGEEGRETHGAIVGKQSPERSSPYGHRLLVSEQTTRAESEGSFSPLPIPRNEPGREGALSRTINVTIGRIEVRGTPERKVQPVPARAPREKASGPTPVMSLDDYLKRYNGREG